MYNRTYTVRLFPTPLQQQELKQLYILRNILWNLLLQFREDHYQKTSKSLNAFDLMKAIPAFKEQHPELLNLNAKVAQVVARQLSNSYQSFLQLKKNGDLTARPPQLIEDLNQTTSLTYNQSGWKFFNSTLRLGKIAAPIAYKGNLSVDNLNVKEIRIKLRNNKWLCDVVAEFPDDYHKNSSCKVLAIDLGLKSLATGIDNAGRAVFLPNKAKKLTKYFDKQVAKVNQKLSSTKKDSKRNKKLKAVRRKLYRKRTAQVKQALHIQSKQLANMNYNTIVIGDLSVKQLMKKPSQHENEQLSIADKGKKKKVRKSFAQSAIDMFRAFLSYKCQGRTNLVELDERHTTQINCLTQKRFEHKVNLENREVQLSENITIDRDLNSAINILRRWESYHLAALTPPLSEETLLKVLNRFNLVEKT